jgi:hypothetical protein
VDNFIYLGPVAVRGRTDTRINGVVASRIWAMHNESLHICDEIE